MNFEIANYLPTVKDRAAQKACMHKGIQIHHNFTLVNDRVNPNNSHDFKQQTVWYV